MLLLLIFNGLPLPSTSGHTPLRSLSMCFVRVIILGRERERKKRDLNWVVFQRRKQRGETIRFLLKCSIFNSLSFYISMWLRLHHSDRWSCPSCDNSGAARFRSWVGIRFLLKCSVLFSLSLSICDSALNTLTCGVPHVTIRELQGFGLGLEYWENPSFEKSRCVFLCMCFFLQLPCELCYLRKQCLSRISYSHT